LFSGLGGRRAFCISMFFLSLHLLYGGVRFPHASFIFDHPSFLPFFFFFFSSSCCFLFLSILPLFLPWRSLLGNGFPFLGGPAHPSGFPRPTYFTHVRPSCVSEVCSPILFPVFYCNLLFALDFCIDIFPSPSRPVSFLGVFLTLACMARGSELHCPDFCLSFGTSFLSRRLRFRPRPTPAINHVTLTRYCHRLYGVLSIIRSLPHFSSWLLALILQPFGFMFCLFFFRRINKLFFSSRAGALPVCTGPFSTMPRKFLLSGLVF